jgi:hypothetical protein
MCIVVIKGCKLRRCRSLCKVGNLMFCSKAWDVWIFEQPVKHSLYDQSSSILNNITLKSLPERESAKDPSKQQKAPSA